MAYSNRTAESFLDASTLRNSFDGFASNVARADQRYRDGLKVGAEANEVHVSINDVWGADCKNGGALSSYERLGYHAGTADFWRGVLDSGCAICVYRVDGNNKIVGHNLRALAARLAA